MKIIYLTLSGVISYLMLFIIGNADAVIVYDQPTNQPHIKLTFIYIILFFITFLSNYYLISKIKRSSPKSMLLSIIASLAIVFHATSINIYITIGDYLRDKHGINWYSMDYGGWTITTGLFNLSLFSAIILLISNYLIYISYTARKKR